MKKKNMTNTNSAEALQEPKANKYLWILLLHIIVLFLSFSGVLSKYASTLKFMSLQFIVVYAAEVFILFVYALLWQQILKRLPLTVAFSNKALGMLWSMLWGGLIFKEQITAPMIIGLLIVLIGVILVVKSDG